MWVEFVGSLLCPERFSPGNSGFPLSPKTNIWFDLCRFDFLSPQLLEPLYLAKYIWDINKVIIIIITIIIIIIIIIIITACCNMNWHTV